MNRYLVLYRSSDDLAGDTAQERAAASPSDQMAAGLSAWQVWYESSRDSVLDFGGPLGKSTALTGGSATPGERSIMGYSVVQAESIDAAVELMKNHPHFHLPGASIELLESVPIPGM